MKRFCSTAFVLVAFSVAHSSTTRAQMVEVGADAGLILPLGDWADISGLGVAFLVRGEVEITPAITVTGRIGYIPHFTTEQLGHDVHTAELPILVGVNYHVALGTFLALELGLVHFDFISSGEFLGEEWSDSDAELEFGGTIGGGYEFGLMNVRAGLFIPAIEDLEDMIGLMVTVGYDFVAF